MMHSESPQKLHGKDPPLLNQNPACGQILAPDEESVPKCETFGAMGSELKGGGSQFCDIQRLAHRKMGFIATEDASA